jgi:hypothetical protein
MWEKESKHRGLENAASLEADASQDAENLELDNHKPTALSSPSDQMQPNFKQVA